MPWAAPTPTISTSSSPPAAPVSALEPTSSSPARPWPKWPNGPHWRSPPMTREFDVTDTARLLIDSRCSLGEGPIWHDGRNQLFWFDIENRTLFAATEEGEQQGEWHFDEIVAAAAIVDDDHLI